MGGTVDVMVNASAAGTASDLSDNVYRSLTAEGGSGGALVTAHRDSSALLIAPRRIERVAVEDMEARFLSEAACRSTGAGDRLVAEEPDRWRTAFARDVDRIRHSTAFRRMAGKCQVVFLPGEDMVRTRLTHSIEVEQIAVAICRGLGLNQTLASAIALGHDCGHGPGGHAAEDAFSRYVDGWDHAEHGPAALAELNLTREVLDGISHHSWRLSAPGTLEGEVVSWADRIAYVCHDVDDALRLGLIRESDIPQDLLAAAGFDHGSRVGYFVSSLLESSLAHGRIGMGVEQCEVLNGLRRFNYEQIYLAERSQAAYGAVVDMLADLVGFYVDNPDVLALAADVPVIGDPPSIASDAVHYVAGMTDRFALGQAYELLGYQSGSIPLLT